jgi:hypothetical protein
VENIQVLVAIILVAIISITMAQVLQEVVTILVEMEGAQAEHLATTDQDLVSVVAQTVLLQVAVAVDQHL